MLMPKNFSDDFSGYYSEALAGFSNWLTSLHAIQYRTTHYHNRIPLVEKTLLSENANA
jgi:hypothetical protein